MIRVCKKPEEEEIDVHIRSNKLSLVRKQQEGKWKEDPRIFFFFF